jgi:hypothetical protein
LSGGDTFTFDNVDLQNGNKYAIYLDANGNSYEYGSLSGGWGGPYTSEFIDMTGSYDDGTFRNADGNPRMILEVGNVGFS